MSCQNNLSLSDVLHRLCADNPTTAHLVSTRALAQPSTAESCLAVALRMGLATADSHESQRMRLCVAACSDALGRKLTLMEWCTALLRVQHRLLTGSQMADWSQRWLYWQELGALCNCDIELSDTVLSASWVEQQRG